MSNLPKRFRFEGTPSELMKTLEKLEAQEISVSIDAHPDTVVSITPTLQSATQNNSPGIMEDYADQKWLRDYQRRLRRDELYQKIKGVAISPVRAVLGIFGYREVPSDAFSVGRDVLPFSRAKRLFGLYKLGPASC